MTTERVSSSDSQPRRSRWSIPWRAMPLSARLVIIFTTLRIVAFLVAGTAMLAILQSHLVNQVDAELEDSARTIATQPPQSLIDSQAPNVPSSHFIRFTLVSGESNELLTASTSARYGRPMIDELIEPGAQVPEEMTHPINVPSTKTGSRWRAVVMPVVADGKPYGTVTVALPLASTLDTTKAIAKYLGLLMLVFVIVGATTSRWLVAHMLRPLSRIEVVASKIAEGDLTQRIDPEPPTTEVGSLTRSLNRMLTQIESSFKAREESQQRTERFVSDASHELRTPLAAIRGYAELYRIGAVPDSNVPDVMNRIESEATRMSNLVDDLLTLARLDERRTINPTDVDLLTLIDDARSHLYALDPTREITILGLGDDAKAPKSLVVEADHDQLAQVLTNLIGNIAVYTPAGSPVEFAIGTEDDTAVIEIRDHGPGIATAEHDKVFNRFYRIDGSRSRSLGGSGLGLAIVSSIMSLHSGDATIDHTPGGGLTVRLTLPRRMRDTKSDADNSDGSPGVV